MSDDSARYGMSMQVSLGSFFDLQHLRPCEASRDPFPGEASTIRLANSHL
jgi:hypothetical protein